MRGQINGLKRKLGDAPSEDGRRIKSVTPAPEAAHTGPVAYFAPQDYGPPGPVGYAQQTPYVHALPTFPQQPVYYQQ